jgi:two-component system response regulator ResD
VDTVQPEVATVLVTTGEAGLRRQLVSRFEKEGYFVEQRDRSAALPDLARELRPTLIIGDMRSDTEDEIVRLRRDDWVPLILLAGAPSYDSCDLLDLGADDVIAQPFSSREVVARARATLRRFVGPPVSPSLTFEGLSIDLKARRVEVHGVSVPLSRREYDLLVFLARHPGQVLTRRQLLQHVWGAEDGWQSPTTVTEHVRRVRLRIGTEREGRSRIETVRGVGYRFRP